MKHPNALVEPSHQGYVGNLPYEMNEDDVAFMFNGLKISNIRMPMDYQANRKKGFAYVEFADRNSLVRALEFNGRVVDERHIRVDVASERKQRPGNQERRFTGDRRTKSGGRPWEPQLPSEEPQQQQAAVRKKLSLLPRTKSTDESSDGPNQAIFGGAAPRDEVAYMERRKSIEIERRKSIDGDEPPVEPTSNNLESPSQK